MLGLEDGLDMVGYRRDWLSFVVYLFILCMGVCVGVVTDCSLGSNRHCLRGLLCVVFLLPIKSFHHLASVYICL